MKTLNILVSILLTIIGLRLLVTPFLPIPRSSAIFNVGEFHAHIGILLIAVGVAFFLAQMQKNI